MIVTVKLTELPLQLFENAVTVILETMGTVKLFVAEKKSILPIPVALIPVAVLSFVHLYSVPGTNDPVNTIGVISPFPQIVISATEFTEGMGFTIISNKEGIPLHPFVNGVTLTVLFIGILEIFCVVNEGIFPVPLVGVNPMVLFVCVQLNNVLLIVDPENITGWVIIFLQYILLLTVSIVGLGFTVITIFAGTPEQEFDIGVTLIRLLMGMLDELLAVKAGILPIPVEESPVLVLLFVHSYIVPTIVDPEKMISLTGWVAHTTWSVSP